MKGDRDLTMRDLKHYGVKPPHFLQTDTGSVVVGIIIGLIGCGIGLFKGF